MRIRATSPHKKTTIMKELNSENLRRDEWSRMQNQQLRIPKKQ
jgi:hypothetical protein